MDARQKMRREGRWIPAFAGMTLRQGLNADLETKKHNPTARPPRHPREGGDPCLSPDHETPWPKPGGKKP